MTFEEIKVGSYFRSLTDYCDVKYGNLYLKLGIAAVDLETEKIYVFPSSADVESVSAVVNIDNSCRYIFRRQENPIFDSLKVNAKFNFNGKSYIKAGEDGAVCLEDGTHCCLFNEEAVV